MRDEQGERQPADGRQPRVRGAEQDGAERCQPRQPGAAPQQERGPVGCCPAESGSRRRHTGCDGQRDQPGVGRAVAQPHRQPGRGTPVQLVERAPVAGRDPAQELFLVQLRELPSTWSHTRQTWDRRAGF
ncbi:hypothetical protein [Streptomyces niveus]|uniref:hypothetical protein n=1 Tax=Streptomyces niveus TaxID=193462 RepID=UPI0003C59209|nr:hypothetical protein M877_18735 [Streptomyces niveus NCIMB 11891]